MLLKNPTWPYKVKHFCRQYPGRCILAAIALVATIWLLLKREYLLALIMFNVVVQCLAAHKIEDKQHHTVFVPDILAELNLKHDMLHVKHRQLHVSKVKKVVLDQLDEQHAFIDFPFNIYQKLAMRFPAGQLPAVQAWVQQHLPDAEIIQ